MSYTFSSPFLPPGFSIVGSKLLATANAPAFTGNITIVLTDGVTTVNKVIAIDRRATTVAALVMQILDLVSIAGPINTFTSFEVVTQTMVSAVGFNESFPLIPMSLLVSVTGSADEFLLGASVMGDNITANGVVFSYTMRAPNYSVVGSFSQAEIVCVYRVFNDSPQTTDEAIGCSTTTAAGFRSALLSAVRTKFNQPPMNYNSCTLKTFVADGPVNIEYTYTTNNGVGGSGGG